MDKVIVYGLGKGYHNNKSIIHNFYDVAGYCDSNTALVQGMEKGMSFEELCKKKDAYDYVLITSIKYAMEIKKKLQENGIEKIKIFPYEDNSRRYWREKPYAGESYTLSFEDLVLDWVREKLEIPYQDMRYIELGVMEPVAGNNTYFFYKRGAKGILVEANPGCIEKIQYARARDKILCRAVFAEHVDTVPFYIADDEGLSSVIEKHVEGWEGHYHVERLEVPVIHINEVFELLEKERDCDLLSIDIEGYDLQALQSLDWKKHRPKIIITELSWGSSGMQLYYQEIVDLLVQKDYFLYANNGYNGIFIDVKYKERFA